MGFDWFKKIEFWKKTLFFDFLKKKKKILNKN